MRGLEVEGRQRVGARGRYQLEILRWYRGLGSLAWRPEHRREHESLGEAGHLASINSCER